MKFEWDEAKRQENIRSHGIDFFDVVTCFDGPIQTYEDDRYPYEEYRYITIGLLRETVVLIAHTETDETIRIFHARKATRKTAETFFRSLAD